MTDKPENPPAFPIQRGLQGAASNDGLTMRDWFAGQALIGILGNEGLMAAFADKSNDGKIKASHVAEIAYLNADAMLSQRSKTE